jgi:hypothetical protein
MAKVANGKLARDGYRASVETGGKIPQLKALVADGVADIEAGRIAEWNLRGFLRRAREKSPE